MIEHKKYPVIQRVKDNPNLFNVNGECYERNKEGTVKLLSSYEYKRRCEGHETETFDPVV